MDALLYAVAWMLVHLLQALPLPWVARLGRAGGAIAAIVDLRHRRVATRNLNQCFARELTPKQLRALVRENFRRIGENYCCAIKTAAMTWEELRSSVEFVGPPWIRQGSLQAPPPSMVVAIGHFGNFELYARFGNFNPAFRCATTYRGLEPRSLNRLMQSLRQRSGCQYFERRTDIAALKAWMAPTGCIIGFLADQHAGRSGVRAPFFDVDCATTAAPVIFALRYRLPLVVAICYRTALARWRIELSPEIPTHENGRPRPVEAITTDFNRQFEVAVRRDPANWFWVHNRWKPDKLPAARVRPANQSAAPKESKPTAPTSPASSGAG